jgi:hypothetical protein
MSGLDKPIDYAYKLNDDKTISKIETLREYAEYMESGNRQVARKTMKLNSIECFVSTVFLVLDRDSYSGGKPLLFETMIFFEEENSLGGSDTLDYQTRCHTYEEALEMHEVAIKYLELMESTMPLPTID